MICPVVWLDLSLNRNTTMLAISSEVVIRFSSGIFDMICANFSFGLGRELIQFS